MYINIFFSKVYLISIVYPKVCMYSFFCYTPLPETLLVYIMVNLSDFCKRRKQELFIVYSNSTGVFEVLLSLIERPFDISGHWKWNYIRWQNILIYDKMCCLIERSRAISLIFEPRTVFRRPPFKVLISWHIPQYLNLHFFMNGIPRMHYISLSHFSTWIILLLKGLGNIVQMRDSGSKVVTSMLDVQLKIIWKFEWKRTIIHGTNWEKLIWSIP